MLEELIDETTEDNPVLDFYKNTNVLITGATGFMGKVLLEKLLRTCVGIEKIYIIIRTKAGVSLEQRCHTLLESNVFNKVKKECPESLLKIKPIYGDMGLDNLGLSPDDEDLLLKNVNVIFHSAASVKFTEPISKIINLNVLATKRLLDLSRKMTNLKSFIYISTAFSHTYAKDAIEEIVRPGEYDPEMILNLMETMPEKLFNSMAETLKGSHHNTYTFTKHMAEILVDRYYQYLPVCIIRPSIVGASATEPIPGWVDNVNGVTCGMLAMYNGSYKIILGGANISADIIPVDYSINFIIVAAWHHLTLRNTKTTVYNSVSSPMNPTSWKQIGEISAKMGRLMPSMKTVNYPIIWFHTANVYVYSFWFAITCKLPALVVDIIGKIYGKKSDNLKIMNTLDKAFKVYRIFSTHTWNYKVGNTVELCEKLERTKDAANFRCDIRYFDWEEYLSNHVIGIRENILKDPMSTLYHAKKRLTKLYILSWFWILLFFYALYCFIQLFF